MRTRSPLVTTILLLALSLATPARADAPADPPSRRRLAIGLGFSHWFGRTFGDLDGLNTPMISVGVRPDLRWLELRARYALAASPQPLPDGKKGVVGFASVAGLLTRELRFGRQSLAGLLGPEIFVTHTNAGGAGWGAGAEAGVELVLRTGGRWTNAVGAYVTAHEVIYVLPGDGSIFGNSRRDAHIDIGVMTTLF